MTIAVTAQAPVQADIVLRVPDWCAGEPVVLVNGEAAEAGIVNGFIRLSRTWQTGDEIALTLPMTITVHPLPDNPASVAFKYGPVVLSASMGQNRMITGTTGVNVTVPSKDNSLTDVLRLTEGTAEEWIAHAAQYMVREPGDEVENDARRSCTERESTTGLRVRRYTVAPEAYSEADWQSSSLLALNKETLSSVDSENLPKSTVPFWAFVMRMPSM